MSATKKVILATNKLILATNNLVSATDMVIYRVILANDEVTTAILKII